MSASTREWEGLLRFQTDEEIMDEIEKMEAEQTTTAAAPYHSGLSRQDLSAINENYCLQLRKQVPNRALAMISANRPRRGVSMTLARNNVTKENDRVIRCNGRLRQKTPVLISRQYVLH